MLGLARALQVDLVVVGPEVPLVAGLADRLRSIGHPGLRPVARRGSDRGLEDVREGGHGRGGRAHRGDARRAACAVRAQGRRARRRQGRRRLPTEAEVEAGLARARRRSPGRSSSRSCSKAPRCRCSRSATASSRWRSRSRRTSSAPRTATGARTPAGWDRSPGARRRRRRGRGARRPARAARCSRSSRRAGAPFVGTLFAGLMLDRRRPAGARVQLPLRRPRDAVAAAAARGRPARGARGRGGRRPRSGVGSAGAPAPPSPSCSPPATTRASGDSGSPITGIEAAEATGALVFHAGTALRDGRVVTNGGRILNVTGVGDDVAAARSAAYAAADLITWSGARRRDDIALVASGGGPGRQAEACRPAGRWAPAGPLRPTL